MPEEFNIFDVYREKGERLGYFRTLHENKALCLDDQTIETVAVGEILKITNIFSKVEYRVKILGTLDQTRYTLMIEVIEEDELPKGSQLKLF